MASTTESSPLEPLRTASPTPELEVSALPLSRGPIELEGPLKVSWRSSAPFVAAHFVPLLALFTGITFTAVVLLVVLYAVRVFCLTAGYHRYFAHRTYKVGRTTQFLLAFGGLTAAQKGPLWWAGWHRQHHRYADTPRDPHSPDQGFWWSHVGWVLSGRYAETPYDQIKDFARYPELRFLDRHDWIGPWALALACYLIGGWSGLVIGFFASTVLVWHVTFSVNSFTHLFGRRRYATNDTSRNLAPVALLTFGEGWHNNHHRHPTSARQGEPWWELDISYMVLRVLAAVGIVRDLKRPRPEALQARRLRDGDPDPRLAAKPAAKPARSARTLTNLLVAGRSCPCLELRGVGVPTFDGVVQARATASRAATTGDLRFRPPTPSDGTAMWQLARSTGLDLNSPYKYVLWGECFAQSSTVAVDAEGAVVGFVTGFHPPDDPSTLFVWQIGVAAPARGRGIAGCMLDDLLARSAARWLEATVTPSNRASAALFRGIATRYETAVDETVAFPQELFPGEHEAEVRFRVGPLRGSSSTAQLTH